MSYYFPKLEQVPAERRLNSLEGILSDDYLARLPHCRDLLELVDKRKVAFQLSQAELTGILQRSGLSLAEQAYVRRVRHQGRNNLAAKRLRNKKREMEFIEELHLDNLRAERDRLEKEKQELAKEIESYRTYLIDC